MELISNWTDWREAYGSKGSRQRKHIDEMLKTRPMLMYLGDSWFSTPLYRNLAKQSASRIDGMGFVIGKPGARADQLFSERNLKSLRDRLQKNPFDALIVSGGGNDSLSRRLDNVFDDWTRKPGSKARISAEDAFRLLVDSHIFSDATGKDEDEGILGSYRHLLAMARDIQNVRPHFRVVGHTYAPLKRIGVPADLTVVNLGLAALLKGEIGPWLWSVMQYVLSDKEEGREFARMLLVDGFRQTVLSVLAKENGNPFSFADFTEVDEIDEDVFWNDEIHPNEEGFEHLAPILNDSIRAVLPESKRDAVG